jgi:hypothetical protein
VIKLRNATARPFATLARGATTRLFSHAKRSHSRPLHLKVFLEHRHADNRRAGAAVRAQHQVDAEHEAVFRGLADQGVKALRDLRKVFVRRDGLSTIGLAAFFIDVDQVDVRRHVQLARAELAHPDDPEIDDRAAVVARDAVARGVVGERLREGALQRCFGELGHRARDVGHRRALLDVEHREPFQHQLARDAHRAGERTAAGQQFLDQRVDAGTRGQAGSEQPELGAIAAPDALYESAVIGTGAKLDR